MNAILHGFEDKSAYAQCIFTFTADGSHVETFVGRTDGRIVPARGDNQFGWDPVRRPRARARDFARGASQPTDRFARSSDTHTQIFEPTGFEPPMTYAEMPKETKNSISHRYRALDKLRKHLTTITGSS